MAFRTLTGFKLEIPEKTVYGSARIPLRVIGQVKIGEVEGELSYQGITAKQKVYMLNGLRTVVAPMKGGAFCICIDYQPLNCYVRLEVYPLLHLPGEKIISKPNANSELWQILLTEWSKSLTTFINPFGH